MADITSNLVGWWKLDEASGTTFVDATGSTNLTLTTGAGSGFANGHQGVAAYNFAGTASGRSAANPTALHVSTAVTILAWVKLNTTFQGQYVGIAGLDYSSPRGNPYWNYKIGMNHTNYASHFGCEFDVGGSATVLDSGFAYAANIWYHVTAVITTTTQTIYVNGDQTATASNTARFSFTGTDKFCIGSNQDALENSDAVIDSVRVYNRALTLSEIQWLYFQGTDPHNMYRHVEVGNCMSRSESAT